MSATDDVIHFTAWSLFLVLWVHVHSVDAHLKKIFNRSVLFGFTFATALTALHVFILSPDDRWGGVRDLMMVGGFSAAVGVSLWFSETWPAGDAKLFFLMCLLAPLLRHFKHLSSSIVLILLANSFVCAAIFVLAQLIVKVGESFGTETPPGLWKILPAFPDALRLAVSVPCYALLFGVVSSVGGRWLEPYLGSSANLIMSGLLVLNSRHLYTAVIGPEFAYYKIAGLLILGLLILKWSTRVPLGSVLWGTLGSGMLMLAFYQLILQPINNFLEVSETEKVPAGADLHRMVLSSSFRQAIMSDRSVDAEDFGPLRIDGLTRAQAEEVQKWCRRRGVLEVEVYRTHPFAFWLFLGAAMTAVLKRDVISAVVFPLARLIHSGLYR